MQAFVDAGFSGVEQAAGVIYARSKPELPEFTAQPIGDAWQLAFAWPLRATAQQVAGWNALHPTLPMDIHQGETRIWMQATAQDLPLWAQMIDAMVAKCTEWRRATRQRDEGM